MLTLVSNADFNSDGDFNRFMSNNRKHGFLSFQLKQPSTEPNILRSVDGIKNHGNNDDEKYAVIMESVHDT